MPGRGGSGAGSIQIEQGPCLRQAGSIRAKYKVKAAAWRLARLAQPLVEHPDHRSCQD
jgi:hypothetical protein